MLDTLYRAARTAANVATLPVSAAADLITFGSIMTDRDECYTETKAKRIAEDGKRLLDDIAG